MISIARSLAVATLLAAAAVASAFAQSDSGASEFDYVRIVVEQNATDGDTEIVIAAKGADDGLQRFSVETPTGRRVALVDSSDPATLGLRQFAFESPEPAGTAILAAYPEGVYVFTGVTAGGERFRGEATLSHALPEPAQLLHPTADSSVSPQALTIRWSASSGAAQYVLEFENESVDPEQSFSVNFPAAVTSFDVPPALLVAGADYQVSVATVAANGNVVVVEAHFSTTP